MQYQQRQENLVNIINRKGLDCVLIKKKVNISYLTGIRGEDAVLLITKNAKKIVVTDSRYKEEYSRHAGKCVIYIIKDKNIYLAIIDICKKMRLKKAGFEANAFSYSEYETLKKGLSLYPINRTVEELRIIKDPEEIKCIKKACLSGLKIMSYAIKMIKPGLREKDVRDCIQAYMLKSGLSQAGFDIIVASGRNASMPHSVVTDKVLRNNEMVTIDLGANYKGYNSDLTRTIFLGKMTKYYKYIYNIVSEAQNLAIGHIKPGMQAKEIDAIARNYLYSKKLGKYFLHSLGHGVGLEIHEAPGITMRSDTILQKDMVITIEPGVYIPGWGGLRIEDMVLVTKTGCEVLTK